MRSHLCCQGPFVKVWHTEFEETVYCTFCWCLLQSSGKTVKKTDGDGTQQPNRKDGSKKAAGKGRLVTFKFPHTVLDYHVTHRMLSVVHTWVLLSLSLYLLWLWGMVHVKVRERVKSLFLIKHYTMTVRRECRHVSFYSEPLHWVAGWMINFMPWQLYTKGKSTLTLLLGALLGPRVNLDAVGKGAIFASTRNQTPVPSLSIS
jgi:hypothetical protein